MNQDQRTRAVVTVARARAPRMRPLELPLPPGPGHRIAALLAGILVFALGLALMPQPPAKTPGTLPGELHSQRVRAPPLPAAAPVDAAPAGSEQPMQDELARLGKPPAADPDPLRRPYQQAPDLYRFMRQLLPRARQGDPASQYYLYLTLDRCQIYLRLTAEQARAQNDRVLLMMNNSPPEERLLWLAEYQRCRGFAGGDLEPLRSAMGPETPGAESEYASIWFQRALLAGYPAAQAEVALRISVLSPLERRSFLEAAVISSDPEVFSLLFLHSHDAVTGAVTPRALAWLLMACRAGYDCSAGAEWYRDSLCTQEGAGCRPGESALEHFWNALPVYEREAGYALAGAIEVALAEGRFDDLPMPALRDERPTTGTAWE